jgi:hypothetical protein
MYTGLSSKSQLKQTKKKNPIYLLPISLVFFWNILVDDDGKQAFEKEKK